MRILKAITSLAVAMRINGLHVSTPMGGMTRQRFQSSVQSLVDDEMALILESSSAVADYITDMEYSSSKFHRKAESKASKRSPSQLRSHDSSETANVSSKLDALFDSIVSHGWDLVRSRSLEEESLFLVCHDSLPLLGGVDRMQQILHYFGMNHTENVFFEPVYYSFQDMCVILSISAGLALNWFNLTHDGLTVVPWVDVMKISSHILTQLLREVPSNEHDDPFSYSIVSSIAFTANATVDDVLGDVLEMAGCKKGHRRQKVGHQITHSKRHRLLEKFSLTKSTKKNIPTLNESGKHWTRMLTNQDCSSILDSIVVTPLSGDSLFRFQFLASASCRISFIVALAVHSSVSRVGTMADGVELHNLHARWVVQGSKKDISGNDIFPWTAVGLNGSSQLIAISDTGLDLQNCYFVDSVSPVIDSRNSIFENWNISRRKILRYDSDSQGGDFVDVFSGHGTHVSATIIGSHINGLGQSKEGIAPAAKAHFFDICTGSRCLSPHKHWFDSFTSEASESPKVASASWGTAYLPTYDWTCYNYDKLVSEHPDLLLVSSAGNNGDKGFSTIGAPASCKNVLAVGATFNVLFGPTSFVASFSSRGPTSDGRIKPDILAPGYKLSSAIAGCHDCSIEESESGLKAGTSMAAPVISGSALLIRQYFEEGYYPCGSRGCGKDIFPSGSLVKAVLLNGAQIQQGVMHAGSGTIKMEEALSDYDNTQGFGAANLLVSLPIERHSNFGVYVRNNELLHFGQTQSFEVDITPESCKLDFSVTLAWYDPPSSVGCTSCLVNDLDLLVEDILSSKHFYPNGLSKPDRVNNVERIRIKNTSPSHRLRITVTATLLGPMHKSQNYSLVATGCFVSPDQLPPQPVLSKSTPDVSQHQTTTNYRLLNNHRVAGIMFSVKAKSKGVSVHSFALPLEENANVYVYMLGKRGIFSNADTTNSSAWVLISPHGGFSVNATGSFNITALPSQSFRVFIPKGSTQSFYITSIGERKMACSRRRSVEGDENIEVEAGIGKNKLFDGRTIRPCFSEGEVIYSAGVDEGSNI